MYAVEKILGAPAGTKVRLTPAAVMINDGSGHKAVNALMAAGSPAAVSSAAGLAASGAPQPDMAASSGISESVRKNITVVLDHDIPAGSFASAFIQKKLIDFSRAWGLDFIQSAGIGYELLYDTKVLPGTVFVSCGSHNSIMGVKGALGFSLTPEAMAGLLAEGCMELTVPETVQVRLTGSFAPGISAWDFAFNHMDLQEPWNQAVRSKVIEYIDETEGGLSESERKVICLGAESQGAFSALFAGAGSTIAADSAGCRGAAPGAEVAGAADTGAEAVDDAAAGPGGTENAITPAADSENAGLTADLSDIHPVAVLPGNLGNHRDLRTLPAVKADACFIGGCAGGRIEVLREAAAILKGRRICRELRLLVGFVDNKTYLQALEEGLIDIFLDCGAQVTNPGCASCRSTSIGVVGDGEVLVSCGCYNDPGCVGTKDSKVYLVSGAEVARTALRGWLDISERRRQ